MNTILVINQLLLPSRTPAATPRRFYNPIASIFVSYQYHLLYIRDPDPKDLCQNLFGRLKLQEPGIDPNPGLKGHGLSTAWPPGHIQASSVVAGNGRMLGEPSDVVIG
jgi:hypothetical protein